MNDLITAMNYAMYAQLSDTRITLDQIDRRLDLYPSYLRYCIDSKFDMQPNDLMRILRETGNLLQRQPSELMTFDQWLLFNGNRELAINKYSQPSIRVPLVSQRLLDDLLNFNPQKRDGEE